MNWKNSLVELTEPLKKCIFVVGPTATGKSNWALQRALECNGSVVNADSVQFYRPLRIGSAAPTEADKAKTPHHLYSYMEPPDEMTAGKFLRDFYKMLEAESPRFPLFIVGGSGFYLQALEKGMYDVDPAKPGLREKIEQRLELEGAEALHKELLSADPQSKIHINDHFRLVRALEIFYSTGQAPSLYRQQPAKNALPFPVLKVGFDYERAELLERVKKRTEKMLADGLIAEVESVLSRASADWAPLQSVGYKEVVEFLSSGRDRSWLAEEITKNTMQLIKKQKTWFKRDGSILWSKQNEALQAFLSTV